MSDSTRGNTYVYRIATLEDWRKAQQDGVYTGAALDNNDGYIHLSTAGQAETTAALYFGGVAGLVLLQVDVAELARHGDLLWEAAPGRDGDLFPHYYSRTGNVELPVAAVVTAHDMPLADDQRTHVFPQSLP